ncbi:MAG: hypothetical protein K2I90_08830, partial [Odoribacter sp.]|nr:hypothetical protein [Odoribacter sp.]
DKIAEQLPGFGNETIEEMFYFLKHILFVLGLIFRCLAENTPSGISGLRISSGYLRKSNANVE